MCRARLPPISRGIITRTEGEQFKNGVVRCNRRKVKSGCTVGCATFESGPGNKIGAYDFLPLKRVVDEAVKKFFQTKQYKW